MRIKKLLAYKGKICHNIIRICLQKEMILSVCKNQQEQELMKGCIYAYCYPAQMVLKSFNDRDKKK